MRAMYGTDAVLRRLVGARLPALQQPHPVLHRHGPQVGCLVLTSVVIVCKDDGQRLVCVSELPLSGSAQSLPGPDRVREGADMSF
eukprot:2463703-Rhodomonas_salina.9